MRLEADIAARVGGFALEARLESDAGVTALFGRSGSGKTTLLNAIAGLVRPQRGRIRVDEIVFYDSERGIDLPARGRRIGYVFQEGRLLPHLTVRQNLLYGRFFTPHAERRASLEQVVALLDLAPLLARRPHHLSGGEKQRVRARGCCSWTSRLPRSMRAARARSSTTSSACATRRSCRSST